VLTVTGSFAEPVVHGHADIVAKLRPHALDLGAGVAISAIVVTQVDRVPVHDAEEHIVA